MNSDEFSNYTLLSYDINKDGQGREDAIFQLKPYIDTESKLVKLLIILHLIILYSQPGDARTPGDT